MKQILSALLLIGLVGCTNPYDPGQRAAGGALIGAGGGAAIGALTGVNPLVGAAVGGLAGAATGVITTPQPPRHHYYNEY
jgi:hypothetical protein